ncbi:hypothetical protein [Primorskyibacter sp. S87]|uniref:hypothetical protein n=1 Tax=Primorskyibacter sp. S87 TaxID=3415126 RepID=UPI003C7D22EB
MNETEIKILSPEEIRAVCREAESQRAVFLAKGLKSLAAALINLPKKLHLAPDCARPLRH